MTGKALSQLVHTAVPGICVDPQLCVTKPCVVTALLIASGLILHSF